MYLEFFYNNDCSNNVDIIESVDSTSRIVPDTLKARHLQNLRASNYVKFLT